VSDQPIPVGTKMSYSSATSTHEGIDALAACGVLCGDVPLPHRGRDQLKS
jgi:hypothetical protein